MVLCWRGSTLLADLEYDADGRRLRRWNRVSGTTDYVYPGLNIIDEVSGGVHEKHLYAGGLHIASNTGGSVEYYHVDHLGSTRLSHRNLHRFGNINRFSTQTPIGINLCVY